MTDLDHASLAKHYEKILRETTDGSVAMSAHMQAASHRLAAKIDSEVRACLQPQFPPVVRAADMHRECVRDGWIMGAHPVRWLRGNDHD